MFDAVATIIDGMNADAEGFARSSLVSIRDNPGRGEDGFMHKSIVAPKGIK
jgi:hypothetical protein